MDEIQETNPTSADSVSIDVAHVARLARLALDEDELARMEVELRAILAYVEELRGLDVSDVPAMSHPLPFSSPYRPDEPAEAIPPAVALAGSSAHDSEAFIVPKVV